MYNKEVGLHRRLLFQLQKSLDLLEQTFSVLSLQRMCEDLVKTDSWAPDPESPHSMVVKGAPKICISDKFSGDANAV